jgi:AcrR family transcriptional regulator
LALLVELPRSNINSHSLIVKAKVNGYLYNGKAMSRHRTQPNSDVLAGTIRVISRVGPARFTLADVAAEVGLAPATLLQRFGSKRGLLLAVASQAATEVEECFSQARSPNRSPLAALNAALREMTQYARSPEEMANGLAFLELDLTDPDFHRLARRSSKAVLAGYRALLDDAIAAHELVACDTGRLARAIQALANGSMLAWAIHREGTLADWLRRDVATLLDPFRARNKRARRESASRLSQRA